MKPRFLGAIRNFFICFFLGVFVLLFQNCSRGFISPQDGASTAQGTPSIPNADNQPLPAISGTPLIRQIRNGQVIATYSKLGEAFMRSHAFRSYESGDIYELEPAVYLGSEQQPWIGPLPKDGAEYSLGVGAWQVPTNIIIRGITRNGYRPLIQVDNTGVSNNTLGQGAIYFDTSKNLTLENIDVDGGGSVGGIPKAGIYINGAQGLTLRNMRILNFSLANGIFGTGNNSGEILFENIETGFNGGNSGPEHNYYMNSSATDQNFKVIWRGCYSHDVYYGHTLKSRAQNNVVEGCHLKGKKVVTPGDQGESYLADFPNGGNVVFKNNVLEKDYSGDNSNGIFFTYAMEGQIFSSNSVAVTHNTFIAKSIYYDSSNHQLYPMNFYYPAQVPGASGFPVPANIKGNLFVGFQDLSFYAGANQRYRGEDYKIISQSELNPDFTMKAPADALLSAAGELAHVFPVGTQLRTGKTFGALDPL